jgi:hypothetical protein
MTPETSSPRVVALMIIALETPEGDSALESVRPAGNALRRVVVELSRWVGPDGCRALLFRALNRAGHDHPALVNIQVVSHSAPVLTGVEESIEANGASAVAAGLTTTLVLLFELLERVIGNDLTLKLAEQITTGNSSSAQGNAHGGQT